MLLELLALIAPVLLTAAAGYGWVQIGQPYDRTLMTRLIADLGAPCLVFASLVQLDAPPQLLLRMAGGALLAMAGFVLVAFPLLRLARLPAHTFLPPMVFANAGNLGLPLCLFAFGDQGLVLAVCFFGTVSLVHYTVGVWVWSGRVSPTEVLRTPLAWAALAAAVVLGAELELPGWVVQTTDLIGRFTIPLMLLTLGVALHDLRPSSIPRSLLLSLLRLGMGFGVGVAVAELLGLVGVARGVLIVESAMPVAVFNYLLAERHGRSPEAVASLVVLSTLLAFALLPALLGYALSVSD